MRTMEASWKFLADQGFFKGCLLKLELRIGTGGEYFLAHNPANAANRWASHRIMFTEAELGFH